MLHLPHNCRVSIFIIILSLLSILSTSFLGIIPGDSKLEEYYIQNDHTPVLHIYVSKGHMFLFCPLINTWSYFRENRVAWPGGRDKAVRKNICSSISLYIIRHQKIVWWGSHLEESLKPMACYFSVCMAYFKQHSCVSTEFHMLWGLLSQRRCENKLPSLLCNDVIVNVSQSAFQMGKKP